MQRPERELAVRRVRPSCWIDFLALRGKGPKDAAPNWNRQRAYLAAPFIRGNIFRMVSMAIAVLVTAALIVEFSGGVGPIMAWVLFGLMIGGGVGAVMAKRVAMTRMPELVAFMHSILALAFVLGVLSVIPIGGTERVMVSVASSHSSRAAAGIGFALNNGMLIIAASLVGSSGAILGYIGCEALNRSYFNAIRAGFGGEAGQGAAGDAVQRHVKSGSADDAALILRTPRSW